MKVILPGYEATKKVLTANSYMLNKYLPSFDVYFLNYGDFDGKLYCGQYVSLDTVQVRGEIGWAKYVVKFLEKLDDKLIIFADGDFLITHLYHKQRYHTLLENMKIYSVGFMSYGYDPKRYSRAGAYAIWNREFLIEILKGCKTIWQFESRAVKHIIKYYDKKIIGWSPVIRYDRSSMISLKRGLGKTAVGEASDEDINYLTSKNYLPKKEDLIIDHPRINNPQISYDDARATSIDVLIELHDERMYTLAKGIKRSVERYRFVSDQLGEPCSVVDLGSGMGFGSLMMAELGHKVTSVDNYEKAIEHAKEFYPYEDGDYILADIETMDVPGYDVAVCLDVICHLKDPEKFISNLKVKKLAVSAMIDIDPEDGYMHWVRNNSILCYPTEQEFRDMFKGWKIINEFKQKNALTMYLERKLP